MEACTALELASLSASIPRRMNGSERRVDQSSVVYRGARDYLRAQTTTLARGCREQRMEADNHYFGQAEEVVVADRALCPIEYARRKAATRSLQPGNVLTAT